MDRQHGFHPFQMTERLATADAPPPVPYPNCYWVIPEKLLAGEYPGDVDETTTKARLLALLQSGIRTFIDLTEEGEIYGAKALGYAGLLKTVADEDRVEITGMRVPIPDRSIPSVWTMRRILDVMDRSIADDNAVFIHCWAGRGRTGTAIGCYLRRHNLVSGPEVVRKLAELRRWMPIGHGNTTFTAWLSVG